LALYNEILVGRLNRALQKFTGIKGQAPAPQLSAEVAATVPLFWGVENRYLESWNKFGIFASATGGAAQFAGFRFRNPAGSNVAVVIEKLFLSWASAETGATQAILAAQAADLTTIVSSSTTRFDNRGNPSPTLVSSTTTNMAGFAGAFFSVRGNANVNLDVVLTEDIEVPLLPGDAISIIDGTAAVRLDVTCWWRERFLEESERS